MVLFMTIFRERKIKFTNSKTLADVAVDRPACYICSDRMWKILGKKKKKKRKQKKKCITDDVDWNMFPFSSCSATLDILVVLTSSYFHYLIQKNTYLRFSDSFQILSTTSVRHEIVLNQIL